jgi:hypothetical protein
MKCVLLYSLFLIPVIAFSSLESNAQIKNIKQPPNIADQRDDLVNKLSATFNLKKEDIQNYLLIEDSLMHNYKKNLRNIN